MQQVCRIFIPLERTITASFEIEIAFNQLRQGAKQMETYEMIEGALQFLMCARLLIQAKTCCSEADVTCIKLA